MWCSEPSDGKQFNIIEELTGTLPNFGVEIRYNRRALAERNLERMAS